VGAARADIAGCIHWYSMGRPHPPLSDTTPEATYLDWLPKLAVVA
jgi:hypothetical protein